MYLPKYLDKYFHEYWDYYIVYFFFQVKILVPNSTAGMVIGKGGNYIKQIKEESGAYIQISQKSKETNLPERCITVAGMLSGGTFCNS